MRWERQRRHFLLVDASPDPRNQAAMWKNIWRAQLPPSTASGMGTPLLVLDPSPWASHPNHHIFLSRCLCWHRSFIFNTAFTSVAFISDRNSDLPPFLSLAGLSNQIFHGGLGWISLLQLQNTQEVGSMGTLRDTHPSRSGGCFAESDRLLLQCLRRFEL